MIDHRELFNALPECYLVLSPQAPGFVILDANSAYLQVAGKTRAIIGQPLFEVFPDNPADPGASGVRNLTASLLSVLHNRKAHEMPIQRYDIRDADGRFRPHYWRPMNVPVFDGERLSCILHVVEEVTDLVALHQDIREQDDRSQHQIQEAVATTQEIERMEISQELHDNINQILYTARLYLEKARSGNGADSGFLEHGHALVIKAIDEVKNLSRALLHDSQAEQQLATSLEDLLAQVTGLKNIQVTRSFELPDESLIASKVKTTVLRILQEQLSNVMRHADARNVDILLHFRDNMLELTVRDDGKGFDMTQATGGAGFENMRTRAALLNGRVEIDSHPGDGCRIRAWIPVDHAGR